MPTPPSWAFRRSSGLKAAENPVLGDARFARGLRGRGHAGVAKSRRDGLEIPPVGFARRFAHFATYRHGLDAARLPSANSILLRAKESPNAALPLVSWR
jgi:hypothetical protein